MDDTIKRFNELRESALELPVRLRAQLIEILRASIAPAVADEQPLTDEEVVEMMRATPLSGEEIVASGLTGIWKDKGIEDPVTWLKEERERYWHERKRKWQRSS